MWRLSARSLFVSPGESMLDNECRSAATRSLDTRLPGTLMLWPGVAEELLATKAYYVRAGLFTDVDVVLHNHVGTI